MINVSFVERHGRGIATIDVDEDSFLVVCRLHYPDHEAPVRSTSDLYSDLLGVPREPRFLLVGDVLFTLTPDERLVSFEWRAGPATLSKGELERIPGGKPVEIRFAADWTKDNRLSVTADTRAKFCPEGSILCISFGPVANVWASAADTLNIGVASTGELASLQLEGIPLDLLRLVGSA